MRAIFLLRSINSGRIAFYYDNKLAIDESIRASEAFVESLRPEYPSLLQEKVNGLELLG